MLWLFIPLGSKRFLSSNVVNQKGFRVRQANTALWRDEACRLAVQEWGRPGLGCCVVDMWVFKGRRGRYDPGNLYPCAKAVVDGFVLGGVFEDDDFSRVDGPHLHHGGFVRGGGGLLVRVCEVDVVPSCPVWHGACVGAGVCLFGGGCCGV